MAAEGGRPQAEQAGPAKHGARIRFVAEITQYGDPGNVLRRHGDDEQGYGNADQTGGRKAGRNEDRI